MFPLMNSIHGSSVSVLSDGCAQLAEDLALPTHLAQIGIQVIKQFSEIFEYPNISDFVTNHGYIEEDLRAYCWVCVVVWM